MSLLDAAYNVVHDYPGGAQSLAPRIGKSASTLSHEVAGDGTAKLGLMDAQKITQRSGDLRILQTFAANCGQMLVPLPAELDGRADDCMLRLADSVIAFGDLCREVGGDLADGKVSDNELLQIDQNCGALIARVHVLRESLQRRNLADKPGHIARPE